MPVETKTCHKCGAGKPLDSFGQDPRYRGGHRHICKTCINRQTYQREMSDPVKHAKRLEINRRATVKHRAGMSASRKKAKLLCYYGLTLEAYQAALKAQEYGCAICRTPFSDRAGEQACVDHCHTSHTFRGVLCRRCNSLLGFVNDNAETLRAAINYLEMER